MATARDDSPGEVTDDDATSGSAKRGSGFRRPSIGPVRSLSRTSLLTAGLGVLVVVLVVLGVITALNLRDEDPAERGQAGRAAALSAARTMVVTLITVDPATAKAGTAKLLAGTTGSFREQFRSTATAFQKTITEGKVTSTGSVTSAATTSVTTDKAVVLVAAAATVKNAATPKGEPRSYRFKLTMAKQSDRWLVSDLTFVA